MKPKTKEWESAVFWEHHPGKREILNLVNKAEYLTRSAGPESFVNSSEIQITLKVEAAF